MLNRRLHSRNEFQDLQTWLYQSEMCERMTDKCGFCYEVGRLSQCISIDAIEMKRPSCFARSNYILASLIWIAQ